MDFNFTDHSEENLQEMEPAPLRSLIRYKAHKTMEVQLYNALLRGNRVSPELGSGVREMLEIWQERGLPTNAPDFEWIARLFDVIEQAQNDPQPDLPGSKITPITETERETVKRLIYERRSIRHFTDEEVPDWMVYEIIRAGLWAAQGGNLGNTRFLVVRESNQPGLFVGSDVRPGSVHIVVCQDLRCYRVIPTYERFRETYETNRVLDCGAAMQNMVLMAHALGLGAVWLTFNSQKMKDVLRAFFDLPEHIAIMNYMDLGYAAYQPIPRGRHNVEEVIIGRV